MAKTFRKKGSSNLRRRRRPKTMTAEEGNWFRSGPCQLYREKISKLRSTVSWGAAAAIKLFSLFFSVWFDERRSRGNKDPFSSMALPLSLSTYLRTKLAWAPFYFLCTRCNLYMLLFAIFVPFETFFGRMFTRISTIFSFFLAPFSWLCV